MSSAQNDEDLAILKDGIDAVINLCGRIQHEVSADGPVRNHAQCQDAATRAAKIIEQSGQSNVEVFTTGLIVSMGVFKTLKQALEGSADGEVDGG